MTKSLFHALILFSLFAIGSPAVAETWQDWVDEARFREIVVQASKKVDLFQAIWQVDPAARFYGGTSRDFLWFVRGELSKATSKEDLERRVTDLLKRPIEAREFIVGQSDVDVITDKPLHSVDYDKSYLTRIETISPSWFQPGSDYFAQEKTQGFVPVEKIQLGKDGFVKPEGLQIGNGVGELYLARPSVHFDPGIVDTPYYKNHENHPVLLALRYLRQVAMAYYRLHGKGLPDEKALFALMDADSAKAVKEVFARLREKPHELTPFVESPLFVKRLNRALGKAFRSYTNPTAANLLFKHFGVDEALVHFGDRIKPYHTLLYHRHLSPGDAALHREQLGLKEPFVSTMGEHFSRKGLTLSHDETAGDYATFLHGTKSLDAYRSIVLQGNITTKEAGDREGVYSVDRTRADTAESYGRGTFVVELKLSPSATVVDISQGAGKSAFDEFQRKAAAGELKWFFDGRPAGKPDVQTFGAFVGADVLYGDGGIGEYIIQNGAAILGQKGLTIPVMTAPQARQDLVKHNLSLERLDQLLKFDPGLIPHLDYLGEGIPERKLIDVLLSQPAPDEIDDSHTKRVLEVTRRYHSKNPLTKAEWDAIMEKVVARAGEELTQATAQFLKNQTPHSLRLHTISGAINDIPVAYLEKAIGEWLAPAPMFLAPLFAKSLDSKTWTPKEWKLALGLARALPLIEEENWSLWSRIQGSVPPADAVGGMPLAERAILAAEIAHNYESAQRFYFPHGDARLPDSIDGWLLKALRIEEKDLELARGMVKLPSGETFDPGIYFAATERWGLSLEDVSRLPAARAVKMLSAIRKAKPDAATETEWKALLDRQLPRLGNELHAITQTGSKGAFLSDQSTGWSWSGINEVIEGLMALPDGKGADFFRDSRRANEWIEQNAVQALLMKKKWRKNEWRAALELFHDAPPTLARWLERAGWDAISMLSNRKSWPKEFWDAIPGLLSRKGEAEVQLATSIQIALRYQTQWTTAVTRAMEERGEKPHDPTPLDETTLKSIGPMPNVPNPHPRKLPPRSPQADCLNAFGEVYDPLNPGFDY